MESESHARHLQLSVNVSARQFRQKSFVDQLRRTLEITGASPDKLKLELTESIVLEDVDKDKTQDVKNIVDVLKRQGRTEGLLHRKVYRPWGWYDSIDNGERFLVKRIVVVGESRSRACNDAAANQ